MHRLAAAHDTAIAAINDSAFGGMGESKLVQAPRHAGLAKIEFAVEPFALVGHVLFSRVDVTVDHRAAKALAFSPVAVRSERGTRRPGRVSAGVRSNQLEHVLTAPGR